MEDACAMRNRHSFTPQNCEDRCILCTAYIAPLFLLVLILGLAILFNVYFILSCTRYDDAWRIVVAIIVMICGNACSALLLWAFYSVVNTPAGYVPADPWRYPPRYVGTSTAYQPPESVNLASMNANAITTTTTATSVNPPCSTNSTANGEGYSCAVDIAGENMFTVKMLDRYNKLRHCRACGLYKPDRAYHCDDCKRCTYNFDHHCPVMNNCIGRDNYKMFVLFLLYVPITAFVVGGFMLLGVFVLAGDAASIIWMVVGVGTCLMGFTTLFFGLAHLWWLYRGESTMSRHIASRMRSSAGASTREVRRAEREEERRCHWDAVLGTDRRWWRVILPIRPTRGGSEGAG